jgi:hypothetical protein
MTMLFTDLTKKLEKVIAHMQIIKIPHSVFQWEI